MSAKLVKILQERIRLLEEQMQTLKELVRSLETVAGNLQETVDLQHQLITDLKDERLALIRSEPSAN